MASNELERRLLNQASATKCQICSGRLFGVIKMVGLSGSVCQACGHVDLFMEGEDANKNGSDQAISGE